MQQRADVRTEVRSFILENFLVGEPSESLEDSTQLISTGIVSSLAMLDIVAFLEKRYGIALREDDLNPDRLDSVALIVALVEELSVKQ